MTSRIAISSQADDDKQYKKASGEKVKKEKALEHIYKKFYKEND